MVRAVSSGSSSSGEDSGAAAVRATLSSGQGHMRNVGIYISIYLPNYACTRVCM